MSTASFAVPSAPRGDLATVVATGSVLAVVDGLSAVAINAVFFHNPSVAHTFQGVAGALLGRQAYALGVEGMLIGIAMHVAVAINAVFFHNPSVAHTFQGVAGALLGRQAYALGVEGMLIGIAMHVAVA